LTYFRFSSSFICSARSSVGGREKVSATAAGVDVEVAAGRGVPLAEAWALDRLLSGERTSDGRRTSGEADIVGGWAVAARGLGWRRARGLLECGWRWEEGLRCSLVG